MILGFLVKAIFYAGLGTVLVKCNGEPEFHIKGNNFNSL